MPNGSNADMNPYAPPSHSMSSETSQGRGGSPNAVRKAVLTYLAAVALVYAMTLTGGLMIYIAISYRWWYCLPLLPILALCLLLWTAYPARWGVK